MKRVILLCVLFLALLHTTYGQVPQITGFGDGYGFPGTNLVITGSHFSTSPTNLKVWFGAVEGQIVSSTSTSVTVVIPQEASFARIAVTNLASGLTGYSDKKFYAVYSGDEQIQTSEFTAPISFDAAAGEKEFYDLCSCDLDGDGKPEIAATKFDAAQDMVILKNNSTPENFNFSFLNSSNIAALNVGAPTLYITCGDLNGDGKPELVSTRSGVTRNNVFILPNTSTSGNITFGARTTLVMSGEVKSRRVRIIDLNFDGKPELVISDANSNILNVFINTSTKTTVSFLANPVLVAVPGAVTTSGIDIEDFNGDGKPDLIVTQFFRDNVFILPNTSSSSAISFGQPLTLTQQGRPLLNVKVGDLDLDGLSDVVATNTSGSDILFFRNTSTGGTLSFASPILFATGNSPWGIDMVDINGDDDLDMVVGNQNQPQIHLIVNNSTPGNFSFQRIDLATDINIRNIISSDFDGDGKPDIGFTSFSGSNGPFRLQLLRNLNCYSPEFLNEEDIITICPGQTPTLSVVPNPAATFKWFKDGATTPLQSGSSSTLQVTVSGSYTVEATSEGGSCVIQETIEVQDGSGSVPSDPSPTSNGPLCQGETLNLSVPEVSGASYAWTGPNGFTSNLRAPLIANVTSAQAGVYQVVISVGDCRSNPATLVVDVVAVPVFTAASQSGNTFCDGNSVQLTVNTVTGYSYQWEKDGVAINGATSTSFSTNEAGVYTARITNTSFGCTLKSNEVTLTTVSQPVAAFDLPSGACVGQSVAINNTSSVDNAATANYAWTFGNGGTSAAAQPTVIYEAVGTYNVTLVVTYSGVNGCTDTFSENINISEPVMPTITADFTDLCPGEALQLNVQGTFENISWNTGQTAASIIVDQAGTYEVSTTDTNGCAAEASITITELSSPSVTASAAREVINRGEQVQLSASGAETYVWRPGGILSDSTIADPLAFPVETTLFTVIGTSIDGCTGEASVTVAVDQSTELSLNPRKAFSPESLINPTWVLDENISNYTSCVLTIFDERGSRLLETDNYANDWDGTYDGNPLPEGVYYYVFECPDGGRVAGTVLLVRN